MTAENSGGSVEDLSLSGTGMPPIEIPDFRGPLDLLLYLIGKNEFSIYDIPISVICAQYHEYLEKMEFLDLESAGEFLWMASWLVYMKSRMLLPQAEDKGGRQDPREELVERLLEYRRVKEFAAILHDGDVLRGGMMQVRIPGGFSSGEEEIDWEDIDLRELAIAYLEAMDRFKAAHPPPLAIRPLRWTVPEKMKELYDRVHREGSLSLLRHLDARPDSEEVVTLFVATLELVRLGGVAARQRRQFAEIYLYPGPRKVDLEKLETILGENLG